MKKYKQIVGESAKHGNKVFIVNDGEYSLLVESVKHKGFQYQISRKNFEKYYEEIKRTPIVKGSPIKK